MFIFQQTDFNPKIYINDILFGCIVCKEWMKHWKGVPLDSFFG